ncbi:3-deoxy-D-manno-octulosonic acid transferase [Tropicimonas sp. IMCC34043]|uniref:3-deoxy-D-manno-octulosonic acid transferase n=1 Tax=Tropicimonas sp. IMCC34043 TaxID=2248760 RepID=UPI000E21F9CF|nr:glycosyltransferase N-terminal domain-containing protein [Tropicimonas sp. IMCC34043]
MFRYRLLLTLLSPVLALWLALRLLRGREGLTDLYERLGGGGSVAPAGGPVLWLHGASNGELTSARTLIETLIARDHALRLVITANNPTGRDMVRGWGLPRVAACLAPLDFRACLRRFLARTTPRALLLLEGDLWPNRMVMAAARGLPVILVSARISTRSAAQWRHMPGAMQAMLGAVTLLSPQDAASAERFRALGLPDASLGPQLSLKSTVALPAPDAAALADLAALLPRADTVLAASTHAGEEAQVIAAFRTAQAERPRLKLILAIRHPARSDEVAALLRDAGLGFSTRSRGEAPGPGTPVYLADTLGEMPLWYTLAGQCFVGGSLVDKGGHTPFEPAQFGCAILHGPHVGNFTESYASLDAMDGAIAVADADGLARALAALDAPRRGRMAENATAALGLDATGLDPLLSRLADVTGLVSLRPDAAAATTQPDIPPT